MITERVPAYSGPEGTITLYYHAGGVSVHVKRIDGSQSYRPNFPGKNAGMAWGREQLIGPARRENGRSYPWGETE